MNSVRPTPPRRSARPVSSTWSASETTPATMLKVPKNIVSASVSGMEALAMALNCHASTVVASDDRRMTAAIAFKYFDSAMILSAECTPPIPSAPAGALGPHRGRPPPPDLEHETDTDQLRCGRQEQHHRRAVTADRQARGQPADDPPQDGPAADQPEGPLRLARGQDEVGQGPHLRRRQDRQHAHPDVDQDEERRALLPRNRGPPPEAQSRDRERDQAAHLEVPQVQALPGADIERRHDADDEGDGDVGVG